MSGSDPLTTVARFLQTLAERYEQAGAARDERLLAELFLTGNLLRLAADEHCDRRPIQVAVIGPTQTGKSTAVNAFLDRDLAKVSPLAGYTVHPHGYAISGAPPADAPPPPIPDSLFDRPPPSQTERDAAGWLQTMFPGWPQRAAGDLRRDELRAYAFSEVRVDGHPLVGCVVWDTPDFDSLAASAYREGLLTVVAAADVFVLVVSKEKYSDASVWRLLELLAPLQRPLLVCLNKMTPDAQAAIAESFRSRLNEHTAQWGAAELITLPQVEDPLQTPAFVTCLPAIRGQIADAARNAQRSDRVPRIAALVDLRWEQWTTPVVREHAALAEWRELVDNALASLLHAYRRDFLEHPDRYDSFRRATVELLQLLELPGVGSHLTKLREAITWPARQVWARGRILMTGVDPQRTPKLPNEQAFLNDELDTVLLTLTRDALRRTEPSRPDAAVWQTLSRRLEGSSGALRTEFRAAARAHYERVQREIHATAGKAYEMLREKPRLLNSLRAARATADASGVVLALKTGGIGLHDVLVAPALFGVTSFLTEGALGGYMDTLHHDLKERQYELARNELVAGQLRETLLNLAQRLDDKGLFGISPEELARARAAVDELRSRPAG